MHVSISGMRFTLRMILISDLGFIDSTQSALFYNYIMEKFGQKETFNKLYSDKLAVELKCRSVIFIQYLI